LLLEGPTRTMRDVPAWWLRPPHGDRRTWRERDGLGLLVLRAPGPLRWRRVAAGAVEPRAAAAAPVGLAARKGALEKVVTGKRTNKVNKANDSRAVNSSSQPDLVRCDSDG
jgi:hypothetical protein